MEQLILSEGWFQNGPYDLTWQQWLICFVGLVILLALGALFLAAIGGPRRPRYGVTLDGGLPIVPVKELPTEPATPPSHPEPDEEYEEITWIVGNMATGEVREERRRSRPVTPEEFVGGWYGLTDRETTPPPAKGGDVD